MPDFTVSTNATPVNVSVEPSAKETLRQAAIATLASATAESAAGPTYASTAAGLAATSDGEAFAVDNGDGTVTVYLNDGGSAVAQRTLATTAALASTDSDKGSALLGYDRDNAYTTGTAGWAINIGGKAVMRPAALGITSSASDQRTALLDMITTAANEGKTIEWGPIDVSLDVETATASKRGLVIPTGSRWVMHPNTRIRAVANDAENYEIINIKDASDIVIEGCGAKIIGDRDDHTGTTGEWGMGVNIQGASDVTIRDLQVEDCWGDGLYIGSTATQAYCENIVLERVVVDNCRRNGLSLISAKNFLCIDSRFTNTDGTAPQHGVDIEPNDVAEFLQNIDFVRVLTQGNSGNGLSMFLNSLDGTANEISIRLIDCVDREAGAIGFMVSTVVDVPGRIELIRPKSYDAQENGILLRRKTQAGARVLIERPYVEDWNRGSVSTAYSTAAIACASPSADAGTNALGGIDIIEPELVLNSGTATGGAIYARDFRSGAETLNDVHIINPLNLSNLLCTLVGTNLTLDDVRRTSATSLTDATATLGGATSLFKHITVPVLSADRIYDIPTNYPIGTELEFAITDSSFKARFRWATSETLWPTNYGAGRVYESTTKGSRLKVRKKWNKLAYDAETAGFTVGATLTGGTSAATATILQVTDSGTTGTLYLKLLSGTFQDNETITDSSGGSATANGTLGAEWFTLEQVGTWAAT